MQRKTIDPVTGRLFAKNSLTDDINVKLKREKERFLERFGHIEGLKQFKEHEKEARRDLKIVREMALDEDKVLLNERQRHWMLAQSHLVMQNMEVDEIQGLHASERGFDGKFHESDYPRLTP
jgi:hypothetical protein